MLVNRFLKFVDFSLGALISLCVLQLATSSHSLEKRDYVIRELVDTECNYVDVLSKIIKYFLRPLTPYLKPQDMQVIFFGVKVRYLYYTMFYFVDCVCVQRTRFKCRGIINTIIIYLLLNHVDINAHLLLRT